jgi:hypothetical protein
VDEAFAAGAEAMRRALSSLREMLALQAEMALSTGMPLQVEGRVAL